jgi:hypothetical protein
MNLRANAVAGSATNRHGGEHEYPTHFRHPDRRGSDRRCGTVKPVPGAIDGPSRGCAKER